jgi:hypothetical protein
MRKNLASLAPLLCLLGCASTTSYVHSDATTLGRVVIYRNGVAYFERTAKVKDDVLRLSVPSDKIDDFLKSLTVTDARTGAPAPIDFPNAPSGGSGFTEMKIHLVGSSPHELKLTYVTESPAWKPSYRVVLRDKGKVDLEGWAVVDNTSGEDWTDVKLGVGSSSALSFRYDLRSLRLVQRQTLQSDDLFALAPPTGQTAYPKDGQKVALDLSDDALAAAEPSPAAEEAAGTRVAQFHSEARKSPPVAGKARMHPASVARGAGAAAAAPAPPAQAVPSFVDIARSLAAANKPIVVEGFANREDGDKHGAALERANRVRDQLIRGGIDPARVVAVSKGEAAGRSGGVRIAEADTKSAKEQPKGAVEAAPAEPIGTSHFESPSAMTVGKGTSAMVSILNAKTDGEVVYLYDAESPRGNASFAFRAVKLANPTDSVLESGPLSVFGEGRFIGEGLCEPIAARSTAFVPFALDRQIVVETKEAEHDTIARILTVQRGVFSTEVRHTRRVTFSLHSRSSEPAAVYLRHTVPQGYQLAKGTASPEKVGGAHLFKVIAAPNGTSELTIEESTPVFKTVDIRSAADMEQVRVYLSGGEVPEALKKPLEDLIKLQQEIGNIEQRISTLREQMQAYRTRMDELHAQVVTLRLVKGGGTLMKNLEKKLSEVSDRLSQATIDLAGYEEKAMLLRIRFQDGVAELSLEGKVAEK